MFKNTASQKLTVFAFATSDHASLTAGDEVTGDSGNITCKVEQDDDGTRTAVDDTNPTETEDGQYVFDLTADETNGDKLTFYPESSTTGVKVVAMPSKVIYTRPPNFAELGIESDGDLTQVNDVANQVTADAVAISGDSTAADNLEAMYDGTGYTDDTAPASRSQVDGLDFSGASVNISPLAAPNGFVLTTGSEVNDEDDVVALDGTRHELSDDSGTLDAYYIFDVEDGVPLSVTFTGVYNGGNDDFDIFVNVGSSGTPNWSQRGTLEGTSSGQNVVHTFTLLVGDTLSDDPSRVWVRIQATGLTSASFDTDQVTMAKAILGRTIGYADGRIWVNTVAGTAGTEPYVNGTADNPVDSWADALTLASSIGISRFHVSAESSITLTGNSSDYNIVGDNWTLAFGGQTITGAYIMGAQVSGTFATTTTAVLEQCIIDAITGPGLTMRSCYFNEVTVTNNGTIGWYLNDCRSRVAGTGRFTFDFGAGVGDTGLSMRNWSGGVELENLGDTGTDNASIEGFGNIVLNANCDGGTLARRGVFDFTDNSGNVTVVEDEITEEIGLVLADTNELQTDWTDGGRLDLILDAIKTDTSQMLSTDLVNILTAVNGVQLDVTAILADTNELQGDWTNGGRLDLILDAVLVDTGTTIPALFPAGFSTVVINSGAVDSLMQGILNTTFTESSAGRMAGNMETFYDNADAATSQTVDDVGSGGGGGSSDWTTAEKEQIRDSLGVDGDKTTASGGQVQTIISTGGPGPWTSGSAASNPNLITSTTIASVDDTRVFTLAAGPPDDDVPNGKCYLILVDQTTSAQKDVLEVTDWDGGDLQVTVAEDPKFTPIAGDLAYLMANPPIGTQDANIVSDSQNIFSAGTTFENSTLTIHRGDTLDSFSIPSLGDMTGFTDKVWLTIKDDLSKDDDEAWLQVELTGVLYIMGSAGPGDTSKGLVTIDSIVNGDLLIDVDADYMAQLLRAIDRKQSNVYFDVQGASADATPKIKTFASGTCKINYDVTRSTS